MKVTRCDLEGLLVVDLDLHGDERGFFVERYNEARFREHGLPTHFVQDNHSRSAPGVLRGLHIQHDPPQGKLVGVAAGSIWDVAVDLRPRSPTYGRHAAFELSDTNARLLWVPPGFGHGFCVLGDRPADVFYKVTALYNRAGESGIRWDDRQLSIPWPVRRPTVSDRDQNLPSFADFSTSSPDPRAGVSKP
jgi:dTDP-4-dehydrorhamnose 3,5-epimerase